jgi:hypothetical protein
MEEKKPHNPAIVFEFNPFPPLDGQKYLLQLNYLRSYDNAGKVKIYLCGKEIAGLDALWSAFATYKYSLMETMVFAFNKDDYCPGAISALSLQSEERGSRKEGDDANAKKRNFVAISHEWASDFLQVRKRQKVKIVRVRVCKLGSST